MLTHHKAILRLGVPIAIGQLGVIIMGFADTMMVGRYSTDSLAAASFVNSVFNLITHFVANGYGKRCVYLHSHHGRLDWGR